MDYKQRYKKLADKIDILCNDFIAAQRDFIKRLDTISFTANFYEAIVGTTDLSSLLYDACKLIKEEVADARTAFFLRRDETFELHIFENDQPIILEKQRLEDCFTQGLVDNICKSNKICTLECLLKMGLQVSPAVLSKLSAVTIPLGQFGKSLGFILIYRSSENKLTSDELNDITAITRGLSRAIECCQALCHCGD